MVWQAMYIHCMYNYDLQKYSIKSGSNESNLETVSNEYVKRQCINF